MRTRVLRVDPRAPDPGAIAEAAEAILRGGLVAFPTETVYGLGALADDAAAVAKVYRAKGRPSHNPLIAHVPGEPEARAVAGAWPRAASELARAFWPGPLTLVVPRGPSIPREVSAGLDTMALRAPAHPVALALLRAVGRPVAAPSANPSTRLSPTRASHVLKGLDGAIDVLLDGGACAYGIESTVVDVTRDPPVALRPGALTLAALRAVAPSLVAREHAPDDGAPRASPGLDRKHYAPRARLRLVARADLAAAAAREPGRVAVVSRGTDAAPAGVVASRVLPSDAEGYAAGLFDALHALDDAGVDAILLEAVPDAPEWSAVRDRLSRASA